MGCVQAKHYVTLYNNSPQRHDCKSNLQSRLGTGAMVPPEDRKLQQKDKEFKASVGYILNSRTAWAI